VSKLAQVIVLSGPTASGKTNLAIELAHKVNGSVISADSMQVYKGLDIGTAKATRHEMAGITHDLIDVVYPDTPYSVADFQRAARGAIETIYARGQVPIIVGGSGLYIQSLIFDYVFDTIEPLDYTRYEMLSTSELAKKLRVVDTKSYEQIDLNNRRRLVHALALAEQTDKTKTAREAAGRTEPLYNFLAFAIMPERATLYERINARSAAMVEAGLVAETDYFNRKFVLAPQIKAAIGYRETLDYLAGGYVDERAYTEAVAQNTRRFAKRQITWLKNQRIPYQWLQSAADTVSMEREIIAFLKK